MYNVLEKIDIKSKIHSQLLKIIGEQGRYDEILILENSSVLEDSVANFRRWLIENKIKHNNIYNVRQLPLEYIKNVVRENRFIVFQTTGTYEIVNILRDYLVFLSTQGHSKKIIEVYTYEPNFGRVPEKANSKNLQAWTLDAFSEDMNELDIEKLKK